MSVTATASFFQDTPGENDPAAMIQLFFFYACIAFVIYNIYIGRNWARLLFSVLTVLEPIVMIPGEVAEFRAVPIKAIVDLLIISPQLAAVPLLYSASATAWFKSPSRREGAVV